MALVARILGPRVGDFEEVALGRAFERVLGERQALAPHRARGRHQKLAAKSTMRHVNSDAQPSTAPRQRRASCTANKGERGVHVICAVGAEERHHEQADHGEGAEACGLVRAAQAPTVDMQ